MEEETYTVTLPNDFVSEAAQNNKIIRVLAVDSSMVSHVGYDFDTQTLLARYTKDGKIYEYHGYSPEKYARLVSAESIGCIFRESVYGLNYTRRFDLEVEHDQQMQAAATAHAEDIERKVLERLQQHQREAERQLSQVRGHEDLRGLLDSFRTFESDMNRNW